MDRFRAIETFVAVADAGSFSAAARKLNISAPSVTRLVSDLESHLGVLLFHRTTRSVKLTEAGQRYFQDSRDILDHMQAAGEAVRGAHSVPSGTLRITASTLFGKIYISPIIAEYLDLYPDVQIEAVFVDRVVNLIEEGLDVAIRIGALPDSGLMANRVGQVQPLLCGASDYFDVYGVPQHPRDLKDHNIIGLAFENYYNYFKFRGGLSVKVKHRLIYNSIPAGLETARQGGGLVRALSYQVGPDLGSGRLHTTLQEYAPDPFPIHVIHGQGRQSSAKVRAFVDMATQRLRDNPFLN